ncbi:MAG: FKBP-type peptidyl-prolyl cis-trans isomerase [Magnetococcales bacterium]|nr:FKBP-type peptidyl-prolyl cis-trans isomerase [Magnetococcales bacterium]
MGLLSNLSKKRLAKNNLKAGRKFLLENSKKAGITTTSSGLQYRVIRQGCGQKTKGWQRVTVHYQGRFINGVEFDSTDEESGPATFALNELISGWSEALKLMNPGSIYQLFIPSELAYGAKGAEDIIGPNEVLIFKTELLKLS